MYPIDSNNINSQSEKNSEIFQTLKSKDSLLFEVGFNQCHLEQIKQLLTDDIEFYQDKDGITISKKKFITTMQNNLCSSGKNNIARVLDNTSFEVFPLYKDEQVNGALLNGTHSFG